MRNPTLLLGILLAASAAGAVPIRVDLEDVGPGAIGPLSFTFDMERQPEAPHAFGDIREFSGDYIGKEEDYRINVADFFRVEMDGWSGFGFNWLLERWPRGIGIFEEYSEIHFFSSPGQILILQGAWTSYWSEDTPLFASLQAGEERLTSEMRIAGIGVAEPPAIPEPAAFALFGLGALSLGAAAGAARLRRVP